MSEAAITGARWLMVAIYALIAWTTCHDGTTAGEFTALAVGAGFAISVVVFADWINRAPGPCRACGSPLLPGETCGRHES